MTEHEILRRRVIQDLLKLEGTDSDLTEDAVRQSQPELHSRACTAFGTWEAALDYAAVRKSRRRQPQVCPQQVIRRIRSRCGALKSMKVKFVRKSDHKLYQHGRACFGTWRNAVRAAGINLGKLYASKRHPILNEDQAIARLRQRIMQDGIPNMTMLACEDQYLTRYLIGHFERFSTAIAIATSQIPAGNQESSNASTEPESNASKNAISKCPEPPHPTPSVPVAEPPHQ